MNLDKIIQESVKEVVGLDGEKFFYKFSQKEINTVVDALIEKALRKEVGVSSYWIRRAIDEYLSSTVTDARARVKEELRSRGM